MSGKYVAPSHGTNAFHCPHCGVYAHQFWYSAMKWSETGRHGSIGNLSVSVCNRCNGYALWLGDKMMYPVSSIAPLPTEDMPANVKEDFQESRNVVNASPRAAAALLRLALQKLMVHLGESGKNINDDIANLVRKGLPEKIQKALDAVRVIGNNAVHPGQIDLKDDTETAVALFDLLNTIVEVMITQPKKIDELYGKIPTSTRKAIQKRDKKK